jgi:replicative DNA helicase
VITQAQLDQVPANLEAERSVLGSVLWDDTLFPQAAVELTPADFHLDTHRQVFQAMAELQKQGKAIDRITVGEQLGQRLKAIGGPVFIASLMEGVPKRKSIEPYTRIVREKSQLRTLMRLCESTYTRASEQQDSPADLLAEVHSQLVNVIAAYGDQGGEWLIQFSDREWAKVLKEREAKGETLGLDTGLERLNSRTGGILPGEFWLLGAKTSDGKSAFSTEVAARNASAGKSIGIFSTEMTRSKVLRRIWTQNLNIDRASSKMRDVRRLSPVEFNQLKDVKNWAATLTIKVEDYSPLDIRTFDAKARLMVQRDKVELIILDHIHEMTAFPQSLPIRERFMIIAEGIRRFVRDTQVPVLGLAQFPKPEKGKHNKRPTKHDFGETGALEQKANVCLLLYRPLTEEDMPTGEDEVIIGKHRDGGVSIVPVRLNTQSLRYEPREVQA